jgi:uncharacterized protein (TIGR00251 family)
LTEAWLSERAGGVEIEVVVVPRASRTQLVGVHDGRLKVQLSAPPVEGEANRALIELFADLLGIKKSAIAILSGQTGKRKRVRVEGVDAARVRALAG